MITWRRSFRAPSCPTSMPRRAPPPCWPGGRCNPGGFSNSSPRPLRSADLFTASRSIATSGAHLPATLARLAKLDINPALGPTPLPSRHDSEENQTEALYARVANRLAELIEGVGSVRVDVDERRELLTLMLRDRGGTEHEARSLSDGTLRFLALAILESDSEARGVLCMEEPENGIHPERISAMLRLLQDLAVDPTLPVDPDNPLRQVIVNTHSPVVASEAPDDSLLMVLPQTSAQRGASRHDPGVPMAPGDLESTGFPRRSDSPSGAVDLLFESGRPDAQPGSSGGSRAGEAPPRNAGDRSSKISSVGCPSVAAASS